MSETCLKQVKNHGLHSIKRFVNTARDFTSFLLKQQTLEIWTEEFVPIGEMKNLKMPEQVENPATVFIYFYLYYLYIFYTLFRKGTGNTASTIAALKIGGKIYGPCYILMNAQGNTREGQNCQNKVSSDLRNGRKPPANTSDEAWN